MRTLPENKNNSQEKNSCLSQRELLNYAAGKLSEKDRKKVETHLLECDSCISLYQEVLNKKESKDRNDKYADLFPEGEKQKLEINFINKKQLVIALALILSVVVLYGAFSKFAKHSVKNEHAHSPISESQELNTESATKQEPVSSVPVNDEKKAAPLSVEKEESKNAATEIKALSENKAVEKKFEETKLKNSQAAPAEPQKSVEKINPPPVLSVSKNAVPAKDTTEKIPATPTAAFIKNYKISKLPEEPAGGYTGKLESIFKQIDQAQYKDALSETGKFSNEYPGDMNARYYRGYLYYQMQNNDQAMSEMEWIINKHDKIFYEDACWYKALILNRTKKPDEAKKILNELASSSSSYSTKAKQLLDLMEGK